MNDVVGTRTPGVNAGHPQHSRLSTVGEEVLAGGAMVAAQWACDMLA